MNRNIKNISFFILIILLLVVIFSDLINNKKKPEKITYSEFLKLAEEKKISSVSITENTLSGLYIDRRGEPHFFTTYAPNDNRLVDRIYPNVKNIEAKPPKEMPFLVNLLFNWLPTLLLIGFFIYMLQRMQGGGGKALSFGKSRAKLQDGSTQKVTFKEVAGIDEVIEEVTEIIEFLKNPKKFTSLGAKIPRGVLLVGPPGCGKTLLARAISGEARVPFFSISGSDFVEMFVGVGASRVRDLFEQARHFASTSKKGCIIFIDEIDAVGRQRGTGLGGGHDEREQTLNQLLVEMDGFDNSTGVILIAATNRPDVLDPALLRPGRFDRQVVLHLPDIKGREAILKVHTESKIPLAPDVDLKIVARGTPNFSGADLANLVNEAALMAARRNKKQVSMAELEEARDKVMMGVERKSRVISEKERRNTAVHEAGHALLAKLLPNMDPLHKVTIIPRGFSAGSTWTLPEEDVHNLSKAFLLDKITMTLGGRAAEVLLINDVTTGAGHDMKVATNLVHKMVCEWGMSSKLGPMTFGSNDEWVFLGKELSRARDYSESTALQIDKEVKRIISECYQRATSLLKDNIKHLENIVEALLEKESLTGEEVDQIIKGTYVSKKNEKEPEDQPEAKPETIKTKEDKRPVKKGEESLVGAQM